MLLPRGVFQVKFDRREGRKRSTIERRLKAFEHIGCVINDQKGVIAERRLRDRMEHCTCQEVPARR